MSLKEMNIGYTEIVDALEHVKSGVLGQNRFASRSTYILCPNSNDLWDFKPVIGLALETAGISLFNDGWVTTRFLNDVLALGISVLVFDKLKGRQLGINDFNPAELLGKHKVIRPDGSELFNYFKPEEKHIILPTGDKRMVLSNQYIRNSASKKEALNRANGHCEACKELGFLTKYDTRFLEAHHKTWLCEGGPDIVENMVALCPNCHRKEHYGKTRRYPRRSWSQ